MKHVKAPERAYEVAVLYQAKVIIPVMARSQDEAMRKGDVFASHMPGFLEIKGTGARLIEV